MLKSGAFLLMCCLHFISVAAYAGEPLEVVTEDWPPYSYLLPDGSVGGIATDKVRSLLDKAGIEYRINLYPWVRAYKMALTQKNVMIYSIYRTREREDKFQWLCPLLPTHSMYVYALSERKDINIDTLEDLKQYIIGITKEEYGYQYLLGHGFVESKHLDITPNYDINLRKLMEKRVDMIIESSHTMKIRLQSIGYKFDRVTPVFEVDTGAVADNCMAFSLGTPAELIEQVRKVFHR
ncbi:transporter substrate-binding domain-containing protein [Thalassomonas viridans]|uniref:Transporter substrate-binding domain-containing protein n=1 Tax=Thalassomonas viridans TaxID=137584 RepID=A0AAE9Z1J0_9GAMM|nr:transporter substrate-binding domain-containing protein [Thalassomonas viridans]WDE04309.1 transporter substrate-binding domain-containing protein [Thalassomonas viridans]